MVPADWVLSKIYVKEEVAMLNRTSKEVNGNAIFK